MISNNFCIVGNAPTELGTGNGSLIDSFDIVYRFNNFKTKGFEEDYGSKTTHWVTTFCGDVRGYEDNDDLQFVCPLNFKDDVVLRRYSATNRSLLNKYKDRTKFPTKDIHDKNVDLLPNPSSGIALIMWLNRLGLEITDSKIFGFSFFDRSKPHHYYTNGGESYHDGIKEKEIYNLILNN